MTQTIDFTVIGDQTIHCASCEQRIGKALQRLDGVQNVRTSATTQQVEVQLAPGGVGAEQLRAALERMGYDVEGGSA